MSERESDLRKEEVVSQAEAIIRAGAEDLTVNLNRKEPESKWLQKINRLLSIFNLGIREEWHYTPFGMRRSYELEKSENSNRRRK